ncbi:MAG: hypothetical protein BRC39_06200, partial [Cyanobacteria bacterium QH_7_48_89]
SELNEEEKKNKGEESIKLISFEKIHEQSGEVLGVVVGTSLLAGRETHPFRQASSEDKGAGGKQASSNAARQAGSELSQQASSKQSSPSTSESPSPASKVAHVSNDVTWVSRSGKTAIENAAEVLCEGGRRLESVRTAFDRSPYVGQIVLDEGQVRECESNPNKSYYGSFNLSHGNYECRGRAELKWANPLAIHIEWYITNLGTYPNCPASTDHWQIDVTADHSELRN